MHWLRSFFTAALASAALFLSASAQAAPVFDFLTESGSFVPVEMTLGYTFEVGPGGISVDGIGIFDFGSDGLASAHEVALWDINQILVIAPEILNPGLPPSNSDMSVSGIGSYIYVDIGAILLGPGEYVLGVSYLPASGNKDVAVNMPDLPILLNAGNVTYGGGVFWGRYRCQCHVTGIFRRRQQLFRTRAPNFGDDPRAPDPGAVDHRYGRYGLQLAEAAAARRRDSCLRNRNLSRRREFRRLGYPGPGHPKT